jgi:hypothetical protein
MKAQIDKAGYLIIERAGKMKAQICTRMGDSKICGDWCPAFQESIDQFKNTLTVSLNCFSQPTEFEDVEDLRKTETNPSGISEEDIKRVFPV